MHLTLRCVTGGVLLLLVAVIAVPSTSYAQKPSESIFEAIPLDSRARLIERLKQYVEYERARQYEKLYELIYDLNDTDASKESYSKSRLEAEARSGIVREFTPTFISNVTLNESDPPTFRLIGQAKVMCKGRTLEKRMSMRARLQDGEWYFSELSDSYLHID